MKKLLVLYLSIISFNVAGVISKGPACGSAEHCYKLLNRAQGFSPKEREEFLATMKTNGLQFAQLILDSTHSLLTDLLKDAATNQDQHLTNKQVAFDNFATTTEQFMTKVFECNNAIEWFKNIGKDDKKLIFDVKEFDCAAVLTKAMHDEIITYPDEVIEWMKSFKEPKRDKTSSVDLKQINGLLETLEKIVQESETDEVCRAALKSIINIFELLDVTVEEGRRYAIELNKTMNVMQQTSQVLIMQQKILDDIGLGEESLRDKLKMAILQQEKMQADLILLHSKVTNLSTLVYTGLAQCYTVSSQRKIVSADIVNLVNNIKSCLIVAVEFNEFLKNAGS